MLRNRILQNFNIVTKDMLVISKEDYDNIGGFDENISNFYNEVDLCLKIRKNRKRIVMNSFAVGTYFKDNQKENLLKQNKEEFKILKNKWKEFFQKEDEYFNLNFNKNSKIIRIDAKAKK